MQREPNEVARVNAVSEDGREYVIITYQSVNVHATQLDGTTPRTPGMKFYETPQGDKVSRVDDETFHIIPLDLMVTVVSSE